MCATGQGTCTGAYRASTRGHHQDCTIDYTTLLTCKHHEYERRSVVEAKAENDLVRAQLKKILSSILEAPLNVECLMNDIDFRSSMTREQFEELAQPVLQRARAPLATVNNPKHPFFLSLQGRDL